MKPKIAFFINGMVIGGAEKDLRLLIETMKDFYDIHLILKIRLENMPVLEDIPIFYLTETESKSSLNFRLRIDVVEQEASDLLNVEKFLK